jgi:S-adenosylmethionine synthetase
MSRTDSFVFTSESVSAGHPDKICDQISDAILDAIIWDAGVNPSYARSAVEVLATTDHLTIAGEVSASSNVVAGFDDVARGVVKRLGYDDPESGFTHDCRIVNLLHSQAMEIQEKVDDGGAGDQGLMFGYANRDTDELMPMPIHAAHMLIERIDQLRESGEMADLRPDGKCQVSVRYVDGQPKSVVKLVIAVPHRESQPKDDLEQELWTNAVDPVLHSLRLEFDGVRGPDNYVVNGGEKGDWHRGGPNYDTGLTGRKIIVDTYGGWARHGGGCFSGKDPTKVDRSAAYMLRYVAKNVVASGLSTSCEVQVSYVIGRAAPLSFTVDTNGTGVMPDQEIETLLADVFDLRPKSIATNLDLWRPIYEATAAYGHMGRQGFTWERTDMAETLARHAKG